MMSFCYSLLKISTFSLETKWLIDDACKRLLKALEKDIINGLK